MKKRIACILAGMFLAMAAIACGNADSNTSGIATEEVKSSTNEELAKKYDASTIVLSDEKITVDGKDISTDMESAVYAANDIVFYLEGQDFTYGEGTEDDEHSQEEADAHTVVHITEPGSYVISGKLSAGQIAVDLGDGAKKDTENVVTLVLNNADITCSVAPGVIFYNVYECGDDDEDDAKKDVDTSAAGANVIIADGSVNTVNGSYVARIYESVELNEAGTEVVDSKKLHKYDAAFYSRRSMNINGEENGTGVLNIQAENEGIGTELHLTVNGGNININSGNDGINTNEEGISVTTINGGSVNITVNGSTGEGDGIDSNGWLVINGGNVTSFACGKSMDAGIDSDNGIHINGGAVTATGNMLDEIAESEQNYVVFNFMESVSDGSVIAIKDTDGKAVSELTAENACSCLVMSTENLTEGIYTLWKDNVQMSVMQSSGGMYGMMGGRPQMGGDRLQGEHPPMPEGGMPQFEQGEHPQMPEGEMPQPPEMSEGEIPQKPDRDLPDGMGMYGDKDWPAERGETLQIPEESENTVASMEFSIVSGGNMFVVVETAE